MSTYAIAEVGREASRGFEPRGGALDLWRCKDHEVILSGPAETGKTFACCQKLDALMWKYPKSVSVVVRKTMASVFTTVLATYKAILGAESPVKFYGGEKPEWADYPNGSRVYFAGLDNPQKALSSERDFIYVNQAEELSLDDWQVLTTRCTGRAANAPYAQIFADCNPGSPVHWIKHRPSLKVFESRHLDNPTLYDADGSITDRGRKTMEVLEALTGVLKERLLYGKWVHAEGTVYDGWDEAIHLVDPFPIPDGWRRIRSIDFGYTNPFVCQWWAIDGDGRIFLYRELYHTKRTVRDHAQRIKDLTGSERIEATITDHDAEDRATLHQEGIHTIPARKTGPDGKAIAAGQAISAGIQLVSQRLRKAGDGKPRLFILRDALVEQDQELARLKQPTSTAQEFTVYMWPKGQDGKPVREVPLDVNNHGMDAMRYGVSYLDWADKPGKPATAARRPAAAVPGLAASTPWLR